MLAFGRIIKDKSSVKITIARNLKRTSMKPSAYIYI